MCLETVDTMKTSAGSLSNSNSGHLELGLQEPENNAREDGGMKKKTDKTKLTAQ